MRNIGTGWRPIRCRLQLPEGVGWTGRARQDNTTGLCEDTPLPVICNEKTGLPHVEHNGVFLQGDTFWVSQRGVTSSHLFIDIFSTAEHLWAHCPTFNKPLFTADILELSQRKILFPITFMLSPFISRIPGRGTMSQHARCPGNKSWNSDIIKSLGALLSPWS